MISTTDSIMAELFDAPLSNPPWKNFLNRLRSAYNLKVCSLLLRQVEPDNPLISIIDCDGSIDAAEGCSIIQNEYCRDKFLPINSLVCGDVIDASDYPEYVESSFYKNFIQGWGGIGHELVVRVTQQGQMDGWLFLDRGVGEEAFTQEEKAEVEALSGYVSKAMRLYERTRLLESIQSTYEASLNSLNIGVLILNSEGQILHKSKIASDQVCRHQSLMRTSGKLVIGNTAKNEEYVKAIKFCSAMRRRLLKSDTRFDRILRINCRCGTQLTLLISPVKEIPWYCGPSSPAVAIYITDQVRKRTSMDALREAYDLTRTEGVLMCLLNEGITLNDAAKEMNISVSTSRNYLKSIFRKADVHRQTDLILAINGSVLPLSQ